MLMIKVFWFFFIGLAVRLLHSTPGVDPMASSISLIWELVRKEDSQASGWTQSAF
jgi:hypothetical protein